MHSSQVARRPKLCFTRYDFIKFRILKVKIKFNEYKSELTTPKVLYLIVSINKATFK